MNSEYVVVTITAASREEAGHIAEALVNERLVACVNILDGIKSIYRWKGNVERADEQLLIAKTRSALLIDLIARVKELHSYEVPEIVALPIVGGLPEYLDWVTENTGQAEDP